MTTKIEFPEGVFGPLKITKQFMCHEREDRSVVELGSGILDSGTGS